MVSRPPWPRRRTDRRRLRRRAAATVLPIRDMIVAYGYEATFLWFGLGRGWWSSSAQLPRAPKPGQTPKAAARLTVSLRDDLPLEDVERRLLAPRSTFVMVGIGLTAMTNCADRRGIFRKLADRDVTILFFTATTLSLALVIDNICNGLARPFFGLVSDIMAARTRWLGIFGAPAVPHRGRARPHAVHVCAHGRAHLLHLGGNLQLFRRHAQTHSG